MLRQTIGTIKKLNKVWLLLLVPLGLLSATIALPLLLIAMMMGTRLLSIFIGPINIWNTPGHAPPPKDIAGIYTPDDESRSAFAREQVALSALSYIKLNADHTLEIRDIPAFDGFGQYQECQYSGTGKWVSMKPVVKSRSTSPHRTRFFHQTQGLRIWRCRLYRAAWPAPTLSPLPNNRRSRQCNRHHLPPSITGKV
jgi:hypothetical protein